MEKPVLKRKPIEPADAMRQLVDFASTHHTDLHDRDPGRDQGPRTKPMTVGEAIGADEIDWTTAQRGWHRLKGTIL